MLQSRFSEVCPLKAVTPYSSQHDKAFWRRAVSNRHFGDIADVFPPIPDLRTSRIATGGSCFAQHIGRQLKLRGLAFIDCEPRPSIVPEWQAARFGYGVYSCRYGNIYTVRQLLQLFEEAYEERTPAEIAWHKEGRVYDALRPGVFEDGFSSFEELKEMRCGHLARCRAMFEELEIFVFTLGLTEAWLSATDGTVYPTAPGVIAGSYDAGNYKFINFEFIDVYRDLELFITKLRAVNANARMILTVSPVPLAATATDDHVVVATTYSKSVLRSVAGEISKKLPGVFYFPSYELISSHIARGMFYNPDLREVNSFGVREVMKHFFGDETASSTQVKGEPADNGLDMDAYVQCEESLING